MTGLDTRGSISDLDPELAEFVKTQEIPKDKFSPLEGEELPENFSLTYDQVMIDFNRVVGIIGIRQFTKDFIDTEGNILYDAHFPNNGIYALPIIIKNSTTLQQIVRVNLLHVLEHKGSLDLLIDTSITLEALPDESVAGLEGIEVSEIPLTSLTDETNDVK